MRAHSNFQFQILNFHFAIPNHRPALPRTQAVIARRSAGFNEWIDPLFDC